MVQIVGATSFLLLPNLLSVEHFAMIVYINILLYYTTFTDLGLTHVYGRKAPGMLAKGLEKDVVSFEDSIQYFWQISTFVFSICASWLLYYKHGSLYLAAIFGLIVNLTPLVTFYISKKVIRGGFVEYRRLTIARSLFTLIGLLGAYLASLTGWLWGMAAGIIALFIYARDKKIYQINWRANPFSYINVVPEGIVLASLTMVWGTLLMSSRIYAAFISPDEIVALYGVVHSGFQVLSGAAIAMCLPVSRHIYFLCGKDKGDVFWFVCKVQMALAVIFTLGSIVVADAAPYLLEFFFIKYDFDPVMVKIVIMSTIAIPFLTSVGSVFIGYEMSKRYLVALSLVLAASFVFLYGTSGIFASLTPAITQFVFLCLGGMTLTVLLWYSFATHSIKSFFVVALPFFLVIIILVISFSIRHISGIYIQHEAMALIFGDSLILLLFVPTVAYLIKNSALYEKYRDLYLKSTGLA